MRGSATVLPATGSATVITPAKIELTSVTPNRTPWGSTVRITGRVLGGYIPSSSKLLRLDLGVVGIPGLSKIQGIPNVSRTAVSPRRTRSPAAPGWCGSG